MSVLRSPLFLVCIVLFITHQVVQKLYPDRFILVHHYLDALLAMPIILTILLAERRWLFKRGAQYKLPLPDTIIATLYIIIISEILFPLLSTKFTADWLDVLCFAVGSILFYLTINKPDQHNKQQA